MIFKSQIFAQVSGSAGGSTFAHNRGGLYMRTRTIPVNPATAQQQVVRNFVAQLTARWNGVLTVAQRDAWNVYAFNVPLIGPTGDPRNVGGIAMYVRSNVPRLQAGLTRIDAAPVIFALPSFVPPTFIATASTDIAAVTFDNTETWAGAAGNAILCFFSRPQSQSILSFKGPYRFAGKIQGAATPPTSPQNINLPFLVTAGAKVFGKFSLVTLDGRLSSTLRADTIAI